MSSVLVLLCVPAWRLILPMIFSEPAHSRPSKCVGSSPAQTESIGAYETHMDSRQAGPEREVTTTTGGRSSRITSRPVSSYPTRSGYFLVLYVSGYCLYKKGHVHREQKSSVNSHRKLGAGPTESQFQQASNTINPRNGGGYKPVLCEQSCVNGFCQQQPHKPG